MSIASIFLVAMDVSWRWTELTRCSDAGTVLSYDNFLTSRTI